MAVTQARKLKEMDKEKYPAEEAGGGSFPSHQGDALNEVISPDRKRQAVHQSIQALDVSERKACRVVGLPRSTQRYNKRPADDEEYLTERIIELASQYGRHSFGL